MCSNHPSPLLPEDLKSSSTESEHKAANAANSGPAHMHTVCTHAPHRSKHWCVCACVHTHAQMGAQHRQADMAEELVYPTGSFYGQAVVSPCSGLKETHGGPGPEHVPPPPAPRVPQSPSKNFSAILKAEELGLMSGGCRKPTEPCRLWRSSPRKSGCSQAPRDPGKDLTANSNPVLPRGRRDAQEARLQAMLLSPLLLLF